MPLTPLLVLGNKLKSNLPSDIGLMDPEAAFRNNIVFVFRLGAWRLCVLRCSRAVTWFSAEVDKHYCCLAVLMYILWYLCFNNREWIITLWLNGSGSTEALQCEPSVGLVCVLFGFKMKHSCLKDLSSLSETKVKTTNRVKRKVWEKS